MKKKVEFGESLEGQISYPENRKVVEHNDLISSVAKMDKTPLKIFEIAVSCIDTDNPPKDNIVYLSKSELFSFFDVSDSNKHTRFKEAVEKMQKTAYFEIKEVQDRGYKIKSIVPIPMVEWNSYNDKVKIRFDIDIMPYLIDLKKNFTQYALSDITDLNSKYSIILYKWFSMFYNQFEHYKEKGGRRESQIDDYRNPSITIQELRQLTDTLDEYARFQSLEFRVIKEPIKEINKHTHFNITYDKIKKGRTIDSIQFHIEKKKIASDINGNYKKEQKDTAYLQNKEEREQQEMMNSAKAMQSEYTRLLSENNLLFPQDFMDMSTMAELQVSVYPIYDELKEKRGIEGVKTHLSYVSAKQEDYSKRNISKYLKKSIVQYMGTL